MLILKNSMTDADSNNVLIDTENLLNQNQLQQYIKLTEAISGLTSLGLIVKRLKKALEEIIPCMRSLIWIHAYTSDTYWTFIDSEKLELKTNQFTAGKSISEKTILHLSNPTADELLNDVTDSIPGAATGHVLCIPLVIEETVIGAIQLMNTTIHPFSNSVTTLLREWVKTAVKIIHSAEKYQEAKFAFDSLVDTLSKTLDTRDYISSGHSRRVTLYAIELAQHMGLNAVELEKLRYAGLLHDIGKLSIPEMILLKNKRPTDDEYEIIKRHAVQTKSFLSKIKFPKNLDDIPEIAQTHHERIDGNGYPAGLKGDQIPLPGKILALCDTFDALTSRRPYDDRIPITKVLELIDNETNLAFEPFVVYHFKNITLDRIIKIMEYGHSDQFESSDLEFLSEYRLVDLTKLKKVKSDKQIKLETIFNRYYSRKYRNI